ncbi:MAG: YhdH/YhfP family quinone oxidoreductase [Pseudomonadota bacterium]
MNKFRAFRIHADANAYRAGVEELTLDDLSPGEVVIEAFYSSVNFKDALAGTGRGKILRRSPLVGGIDVSGRVMSSTDARFQIGDQVLVTGCGLSERHDGGYAERVRVPADWVVPIPDSLDPFKVMVIGTAGFTAALAIERMQDNHQAPRLGPVLVTGATGGVGSFAISLLNGLGYEVVALTGKTDATPYLLSLGADRVLDRRSLDLESHPLEPAQWGGAIDSVGGDILSWITRTVNPWGNIASIGLAAGVDLKTTVMPFILRGVSLLGISSVNCPRQWRMRVWQKLGSDMYPRHLDSIVTDTVSMEQLPGVFERVLNGKIKGRVVVDIKSGSR